MACGEPGNIMACGEPRNGVVVGSSRYRDHGGRGPGRSAPLPPRIDENPQDYEPYPNAEPPRATQDRGGRDPRRPGGPVAPGSRPPNRSGPYAPAPQDFGRAPGSDSWPAVDRDSRPFIEQGSFGPRWAAAGAGLPDGPDVPPAPSVAGPWNPQGRVLNPPEPTRPEPTSPGPTPPEWPRSAGESPAAFGAGYLNAYEETRPEAPGNFPPQVRRRNRLLTTAAVVAIALLAGIAIFVIRHSGGKAGHTPGPASAASRKPDAGATHEASIGPRAISAALIFPHAHVVAGGITFHRVTAVLNKQCALTARGAFAKALKSGGCRRVVRATFVDSAKRYAVTAGVARLSSPAAAKAANRSMHFGPDVWFTGLDGPARSGATVVSTSVGLGYDTVYGRYIVYALATYSDGRSPAGHAAAVKTLKDLARSFGVMARQPLVAQAERSRG